MAKKKLYYKLGEKATSFTDTYSTFELVNKQVAIASGKTLTSKIFINALANGHLVSATEEEFKKFLAVNEATVNEGTSVRELKALVAELNLKVASREEELLAKEEEISNLKNTIKDLEAEDESVDFNKMTKAQCLEYYLEEYDVNPESKIEFESLDLAGRRNFLIDLEDNSEQE